MSPGTDPVPGWLSAEVSEEFPDVRLLECEVEVRRRDSLLGRSPPDVEARMRELSNGFRGARAIGIRREPIPAAYRVFFRQIGLDPDVRRTPIESAVLERMLRGGFLTGGLLEDVLLIALADTGVPVWALDSAKLDGSLGLRASRGAEPLGDGKEPPLIPAGRLVVADGAVAIAVLFEPPASSHRPRAHSPVLRVFTIQVPGVPALYAEEALWNARAALELP